MTVDISFEEWLDVSDREIMMWFQQPHTAQEKEAKKKEILLVDALCRLVRRLEERQQKLADAANSR